MAKVVFNKKMVTDKVRAKLSLFVRKIALDGLRQLIRQSPVDTGRFKANWSTSVGILGQGTSKKTESDEDIQGKGLAGYKAGQKAYLYNNLQYAIPLEYGSSLQAPNGWVRRTSDLMQKKLNEVKDLI